MKIMIADSSAVVRAVFAQKLNKYGDYNIIASVSNCQKLITSVKIEKPDVIICGNDLSDSEEASALKLLCVTYNLPALILSADNENPFFISKNSAVISKPNIKDYTSEYFNAVSNKLNELTKKRSSVSEPLNEKVVYKVLCIGASTGGPTAVADVLNGLGENFPLPILYAQHIEVGKDKDLAEWLNSVCNNLSVRLAKEGETALPGTVYMAPADTHLVIDYLDNTQKPVLRLSDEAPERFLRPAVNKLFKSAAEKYKCNALAILLTGMGADGATGCKEICDNGGWTIVEDKSTCAVFGMPAAAIEAGGAKEVLPRTEIAKRIKELTAK